MRGPRKRPGRDEVKKAGAGIGAGDAGAECGQGAARWAWQEAMIGHFRRQFAFCERSAACLAEICRSGNGSDSSTIWFHCASFSGVTGVTGRYFGAVTLGTPPTNCFSLCFRDALPTLPTLPALSPGRICAQDRVARLRASGDIARLAAAVGELPRERRAAGRRGQHAPRTLPLSASIEGRASSEISGSTDRPSRIFRGCGISRPNASANKRGLRLAG